MKIEKLKITPLPWQYGRDLCVSYRPAGDEYDEVVAVVAVKDYLDPEEVAKANVCGKLLAAAPDMLEALIEIVDGGYFHEVNTQRRYERVIEKAIGLTWAEIMEIIK